MTWQRFDGTAKQWDDVVERLGATTPFQLSAWAAFRQSFGWDSLRLETTDGSAAIQLLIKSIGPARIAWAPGAPLGDVSTEQLREIAGATRRLIGGAVTYVRIADHHPQDANRIESFRNAGWSRCSASLGGSETLVRSLDLHSGPISDSYSSNWSRNLRRGIQREITADVWDSPEPDLVARIHRDVEAAKEPFRAEWRGESSSIERLIETFGERLIVVKAQDKTRAVLALRAAVIVGSNAFDFLAATSNVGRKLYASNVALDALLGALAARGIMRYDFGGVDRTNNKGVFDFKHGAGGTDFVYTGEFETAVPRLAKPVVSKLMSLRLWA
ncbi:MAG: hypothetical protein RL072_547 [Actinomycetota bacterium]|jgi:hypothetical protein